VRLASPSSGERATLLDTIPSDTIQRLEVYKAVLPNMPGDTVGGYINIKTPSAYDFDARVARVSMQGTYSDLVDSWDGKIAASWGDVFNNSKVGLMLNVSYEERSFGSDNNEADPWEIESGTDGTEGYVSSEVQYREYDLVRKRTGVSANLEFKPEHDRYFYIRASYNNYEDVEFRHSAIFEPDDFSAISGNSFTGIDTEHVREIKDREENMNIQALSVGGENTWDSWTLDYRLSYSYAKEDTPYDSEMIYEFGDVVDVRFTGTDSYLLGLSQVGGPSLTDPANYEFDEITDGFQLVEETDWSLELNARYAFDQQAYEKGSGIADQEGQCQHDQPEPDRCPKRADISVGGEEVAPAIQRQGRVDRKGRLGPEGHIDDHHDRRDEEQDHPDHAGREKLEGVCLLPVGAGGTHLAISLPNTIAFAGSHERM